MDESFSAPGGGFVNLDFFERMVLTPGVTHVTMLGEGSFHQVHGGTTTNITEPHELVRSYDDQYEELRGRRFQIPPQRAHFVGSLTPMARRTKPRRMTSFKHFRNAHASAADGLPARRDAGAAGPEDRVHRRFLAQRRVASDLVARQVDPQAADRPARLPGADLPGAARVDHRDPHRRRGPGALPGLDLRPRRIRPGALDRPLPARRASRSSADHPSAWRSRRGARRPGRRARSPGSARGPWSSSAAATGSRSLGAFRNYAPLVPVGSYVVVEDTILEGNPVWADFGSGPASAVREIADEGEFVPDFSLERFALTFNPGGFLKRVR